MNKREVLEIIQNRRLVAIVRLDDLSRSRELVQAMLVGGVRAIEFTLTNDKTPEVVAGLLQSVPQFRSGEATIGVGSVRSADEAQLAIDCGAQFIVCPISRESIIRKANQAEIAVMPGAFTPTEIAQAHDWGADVVKVFPAKGLGPGYFKDVLAPMPYLKLMPTGGVDLNNISNYFQAGAIAVGVGSQLLDPRGVADGDWADIQLAAEKYTKAALRV